MIKLTPGAISEVSGTGISKEQIEDNHTVPDFDTTLLICHFLGIEVDWGWLRLITEIVNF